MNPPPLLVYGLGRSGGAVVERARKHGERVIFLEGRAHGADIERALALGAERLSDVSEAIAQRPAICVAAPGVAIDHPDLQALRNAGVEVIGEVVWVLRSQPGRCVAVTGTAGKGSVTDWTSRALQHAGLAAVAGGNIDPALAAVAEPGKVLVIEMSSFQLERAPGFRPEVAVVLNLGRDHLDRHGSVAAYHAAKYNLIRNLGPAETFIGNDDDPRVSAWLDASPARTRRYSLLRASDAHYHRQRDELWLDGSPLIPRSELSLRGDHQVGNALAVALALDALGVERDAIASGLRELRSLHGRYASVGNLGGVEFIEDSIATRELAVSAALHATPAPVVWIAGGADKGAEVATLAPLLRERVSLMLGIGAAGAAYADVAAGFTRAEVIDEADGERALERAVGRAFEHLRHHHQGRGSVLLAPLAASFDQFRDYRARAAAFRGAVARLAAEVSAREGVTWTPSS
jgi:UDP-N-acetylmuramoylalanine--D-glutamate ligase